MIKDIDDVYVMQKESRMIFYIKSTTREIQKLIIIINKWISIIVLPQINLKINKIVSLDFEYLDFD